MTFGRLTEVMPSMSIGWSKVLGRIHAQGYTDNVVDLMVGKLGRLTVETQKAGRGVTLGMQALKRIAKPDDIGGVIAFLASDTARWITGDTVRVDGGSKL